MEASKPPTSAASRASNGGAARPTYPPSKAQQYRLPYRAQRRPSPRRKRRCHQGCCRICCLWLSLLLIALVILAAISAGAFYVLCLPQRPSFSVSSLRLSALDVRSADLLTSRLDLSVTARNPNQRIVFVFGDVALSASSGGVTIGEGTIPGFVQGTDNTTVLKATVSSSGRSLDPTEASDLRRKKRHSLEIHLDTNAGIKLGRFKSLHVGLRISCKGIEASVTKGNATAASTKSSAKCKARLRVKVWGWTL